MSQINEVATLRSAVLPRSSAITNTALILGGAAFLALTAQISIPVPGSPVPVTGQTLGVLLLGTAYGASLGLSTFAFYILAGIAGAPIFASHGSGLAHLTGATGGYLAGMAVASLITGSLAGRKWDQKFSSSIPTMLLGNLAVFTLGAIWLQHSFHMSWAMTFDKGVRPFIYGEALKIAIAATALPALWSVVNKRTSK